MPTPAAIAAVPTTRLRFIGYRFPRSLYMFNMLVERLPG
jgi:hypothetical protein